jgi:hypothetical protein
MCTSGKAVAAAASWTVLRREMGFVVGMKVSLSGGSPGFVGAPCWPGVSYFYGNAWPDGTEKSIWVRIFYTVGCWFWRFV